MDDPAQVLSRLATGNLKARQSGKAVQRRKDRVLNVALLTCRAFAAPEPHERQAWRMHVGAAGVRALFPAQGRGLAFDRAFFARDPRIAGLNWDR